MKNIKIVLTGGPCGGKTSSLNYLRDNLSKSYNVLITEETANGLLKLGYLDEIQISIFDFQHLLFNIQFINEYSAEKESEILLCDRGLLDSKAYLDEQRFNKILDLNNIQHSEILSTYDFALYYRTIAYEYPDLFKQKRMFETPESAILRDQKSMEIWKDIFLNIKYLNTEGFLIKINKIYEAAIHKISEMNFDSRISLSDYYSIETINLMLESINHILYKNGIKDNIKEKTLRLIKW